MILGEIAALGDLFNGYLEQGKRHYVLNLVNVTDITSTGVSLMANIQKDLHKRSQCLVLADISPVCEYVLDLTGMPNHFTIFKTQEEAVRSLRSRLN